MQTWLLWITSNVREIEEQFQFPRKGRASSSGKRRSYLLSASPLALVLVRLDYPAPNCPDDLRIADQDGDDLADDEKNADYDADVC